MSQAPAPTPLRVDVAIVGAGAAGLYAALVAAREGARVALVSRSPLPGSASYWAQGGIAAALAEDDSPEQHLEDTLTAGRAASREDAARILCEEAAARVRDLEQLGVRFDADEDGTLALGLEGGHSVRRVVHAGGAATGRRITQELSSLVAASEQIEALDQTSAAVLWNAEGRCLGLIAERRGGGATTPVLARATILATGGAAALWERTTNPRGAIGAGMTLAHAAGAALADLELTQFHPTALVDPGRPRDGFLITEAVRGEGALLRNGAGERFVEELAPRDEVALAIHAELRRSGDASVFLDMRAVEPGRFPNIESALGEIGLDPRRDLVPVAPASHYVMGGIATDLDGRSSLAGLYAIGECACTGLHGANRLASNSLAECFVFGRRAALAATDEPAVPAGSPSAEPPSSGPSQIVPSPESREALWHDAGLLRSRAGLERLAEDPFPLARLIGRSALARSESRGAHQRSDHPQADPALDGHHSIVGADESVSLEAWG